MNYLEAYVLSAFVAGLTVYGLAWITTTRLKRYGELYAFIAITGLLAAIVTGLSFVGLLTILIKHLVAG